MDGVVPDFRWLGSALATVLTLVAIRNVAAAVPRVMMAYRIAQDAPPLQQTIFATGVTADEAVVSRSHVWPIVLALNGLILVVLSDLSMGLMWQVFWV
ncbi:hypothetical protein [Nitrosococcus watsonii]|uniref:hypothetical protein n=1 Tax=Nitrosococcus watsonii TaxID=473531 RepID=UPI000306E83F|nr:hypothetical protein [Nitrosococcus watsonii]